MAIYADDAGTLVIWTTAGRGGETESRGGSGERRSRETRERPELEKNSWALGLSAIRIKMRCVMWAIWCRCKKKKRKEQRRGMQQKGGGCTGYEAWSMVCLMVPQPVHRLALSCNYLYSCCPPVCLPAWLPGCMLPHCVNVNVATTKLATRVAWRLSMSMSGRAVNAAAAVGAIAGAATGAGAIECVLLNAMCTRDTHPPPAPILAHTHTRTLLRSPNTGPGNVERHAQTRPERERELVGTAVGAFGFGALRLRLYY